MFCGNLLKQWGQHSCTRISLLLQIRAVEWESHQTWAQDGHRILKIIVTFSHSQWTTWNPCRHVHWPTRSFEFIYMPQVSKKKKKKPAVYKTWNDANCNHTSQAKQETKLYRQTALPCQCMSNQDRLSPSRGASQVFIICTCNTE